MHWSRHPQLVPPCMAMALRFTNLLSWSVSLFLLCSYNLSGPGIPHSYLQIRYSATRSSLSGPKQVEAGGGHWEAMRALSLWLPGRN